MDWACLWHMTPDAGLSPSGVHVESVRENAVFPLSQVLVQHGQSSVSSGHCPSSGEKYTFNSNSEFQAVCVDQKAIALSMHAMLVCHVRLAMSLLPCNHCYAVTLITPARSD